MEVVNDFKSYKVRFKDFYIEYTNFGKINGYYGNK